MNRSHWGILVKNLDSGAIIYSRNSNKYFVPASNVKLLTTAAALLELGADFRIKTPIYATGKAPILQELRIKGRGDPTLSSSSLKNIVQQLKELGITRIEKLIIEDSYFNQNPVNPTWEWSDIHYYYAVAVNSIILNENSFTITLLPTKIGEKAVVKWSDTIAVRQWRIINNSITETIDTPYNIDINGEQGNPTLNITGNIPQDRQPDVWNLAILDPPNYFLETLRSLLDGGRD